MINPTEADIGRMVLYTGNQHWGGSLEEGVITGFNDYCVFVRYRGETQAKGTQRTDLKWSIPREGKDDQG